MPVHAVTSQRKGASNALLDVRHLSVAIQGAPVLNDVSLQVRAGELVGLVGESGSGKTLTGLSVMGLLPESARVSGEVEFDGVDLLRASPGRLRGLRGSEIGMIFQEPRASLHPSRPVGKQIVDVLRSHESLSVNAARKRAEEMLDLVGLPDPRRAMRGYTHELSGGMCQRVMIAMALVCRPRLLVADEPTTALDVTIQAQVVALLRRLVAELDLAVLLVTHNLGVVAELCSRVVTMYCGQIVNDDATEQLLAAPRHPYPWALMRASSVELRSDAGWGGIPGAPASPLRPPDGCRFHPRCPFATAQCATTAPDLRSVGGGATRCARIDEIELEGVPA